MFAVIRHIPNKHQKLVRYYGAYSRSRRRIIRRQSSMYSGILSDHVGKRCFRCPDCNELMEIVWYCRKPPPKNKEKLEYWLQIN